MGSLDWPHLVFEEIKKKLRGETNYDLLWDCVFGKLLLQEIRFLIFGRKVSNIIIIDSHVVLADCIKGNPLAKEQGPGRIYLYNDDMFKELFEDKEAKRTGVRNNFLFFNVIITMTSSYPIITMTAPNF
jgi:hypothetical protein